MPRYHKTEQIFSSIHFHFVERQGGSTKFKIINFLKLNTATQVRSNALAMFKMTESQKTRGME